MANLKKYKISLPCTKTEQTAIATALNDADTLITQLEKLIAKKRNIKQGAMQELLTGKKRLPGFGGKLVSMGNGKLRDLFEISPPRKQIGRDEVVTFIGMEDVSEDGTIISHNLLPYSEIKNGLTYFEKKDVLVAKITPCFENGKGACLDNLKTEKGFGSTEFHILRANNNSVPRYVFYHTQSAKFRRKLEAEMVGSAGQKRVSSSAILNYPLSIVHSKAEQTAVAQILSDMDAEIEALEQKLVKYRMIKQGMMQELLTGKTRLV
jgi:type I restriction enzyme S subunit